MVQAMNCGTSWEEEHQLSPRLSWQFCFLAEELGKLYSWGIMVESFCLGKGLERTSTYEEEALQKRSILGGSWHSSLSAA